MAQLEQSSRFEKNLAEKNEQIASLQEGLQEARSHCQDKDHEVKRLAQSLSECNSIH